MTPTELMAELKKANISLSVNENDLVIRGKKQLLGAELLTQLREHKLALIELLQGEEADRAGNHGRSHSREEAPLEELTAADLEEIVKAVPGGAANLQDVYPLAPLQEGILFHHLLDEEGDAYLLRFLSSFDTRARLDQYVTALQAVIERNDILRTAVLWEGLPEPMQVVWHKAPLQVEEIELDPAAGDAADLMFARYDPRHTRIDVRQAPLLRLYIAFDRAKDRWLMLTLLHHLAGDNATLDVMHAEIQAYLLGQEEQLPKPLPFRSLVMEARHGVSPQEHEAFFRQMLGDVNEPTTPFGLLDVLGDGNDIEEAHLVLDDELALRLRASARHLGVSAASLCHVAWAQVLAKASGRDDVVFGTVLFGRMQSGEGTARILGLFINTLPVRIAVGEQGAAASTKHTHALLAELMHHEHASLALAQRCSAVPAPAPLFSSILNYRFSEPEARSEEALQAWKGIEKLRMGTRTNYPLMISVDDLGRGFSLDVQTHASVGPMRVCELMRTALESLIDALESAPGSALRELEVLSPSERHQLLHEWNDTEVAYPAQSNIHALIEAQVRRTPDAAAVVFEDASLTYAELDQRANQLAHHLTGLGIGPEVLVGVCLERSLDMVVGVLAILKAGGAYVPLDPSFPQNRLSDMVEDSRMSVLLTHRGLEQQLHVRPPAMVRMDSDWNEIAKHRTDPAGLPSAGSNNRAYVLYTSGSTGKPKGVEIPHSALVNFLLSMQREPGFHATDKVLAVTTLSFDIAGLEIYLPLITGGQVIIASREVTHDPALLMDLMRVSGCTVMQATPATWRALIETGWKGSPDLKILCGGEALPSDLGEELLSRCGELWNMYGPTETTVWSTVHKVSSARGSVPIGKPIANTQLYLLDARCTLVPRGAIGELYIGGDGLARGYLHREELTKERFVPNPFQPGARMYRTGDLARWLPDGTVECLGRVDNQVKLRGFRIELGEIEARLAEHPQVREAVVIAREDTPGDKRLVAYYTASPLAKAREGNLGMEQLRTHLSACLPEYMVPSAYVRLESLPLTPNGKLDRKALPAPEAGASSALAYEPPKGETETKLAAIWAEVLKVDRIGRQVNFFDLGGHSLMAARAIALLNREFGTALPVRVLFQANTVSKLASVIGKKDGVQEGGWPSLIPIQTHGTHSPLFCVARPNVNALGFLMLSRELGSDRPVYGLQVQLEEDPELDFTDEQYHATTAEYIRAMKTVQPHGPYNLIGQCQGAYIAFEMVQALEKAGEEVVFLGILDTWTEENTRRKWLFRVELELRRIRSLDRKKIRKAFDQVRARLARRKASDCPVKSSQAGSHPKMTLAQKYFPGKDFVPTVCCCPITVFGVRGRPWYRKHDETMGWGDRTRTVVRSRIIPGDHFSFTRYPYVTELAAMIAEYLDEAAQGASRLEVGADRELVGSALPGGPNPLRS